MMTDVEHAAMHRWLEIRGNAEKDARTEDALPPRPAAANTLDGAVLCAARVLWQEHPAYIGIGLASLLVVTIWKVFKIVHWFIA